MSVKNQTSYHNPTNSMSSTDSTCSDETRQNSIDTRPSTGNSEIIELERQRPKNLGKIDDKSKKDYIDHLTHTVAEAKEQLVYAEKAQKWSAIHLRALHERVINHKLALEYYQLELKGSGTQNVQAVKDAYLALNNQEKIYDKAWKAWCDEKQPDVLNSQVEESTPTAQPIGKYHKHSLSAIAQSTKNVRFAEAIDAQNNPRYGRPIAPKNASSSPPVAHSQPRPQHDPWEIARQRAVNVQHRVQRFMALNLVIDAQNNARLGPPVVPNKPELSPKQLKQLGARNAKFIQGIEDAVKGRAVPNEQVAQPREVVRDSQNKLDKSDSETHDTLNGRRG